jgi:hypothetical protein
MKLIFIRIQTAVDHSKYNESLSDRRAQSTIGWLMGGNRLTAKDMEKPTHK